VAAWLTHRQARKHMIGRVRRRLNHAPGIAQGANSMALAGIGDKVVVPAFVTPCAGKPENQCIDCAIRF
jgi:hypothetical protein